MVYVINLAILFLACFGNKVEGISNRLDEEDDKLKKQLEILNKSSIKTFQTNGGIYDCIDIKKQPAFDHPLLTNHKIQMKPSSYPKLSSDETPLRENFTITTLNGIICPKGTVPIRRTTKDDLIKAKYFTNTRETRVHPESHDRPGYHVSVLKLINDNAPYYGAQATTSVHRLQVDNGQYSTSQMWIESDLGDQFVSLEFGWMVSPDLNGNSDTYLYIYWANGDPKSACYNFLCPGFLQTHHGIAPGTRLTEISTYGGEQKTIELSVHQDRNSGNWWLSVNKVDVGYWPRELVLGLNRGAQYIVWGGLALGPPNGNSPPMGNGYYANGDYKTACYMENLCFIDGSNRCVIPKEEAIVPYHDNNCYNNLFMGNRKSNGISFLFGGPGGHCEP